MADKATGTLVIVLIIGALIGAGGMYYYMQPQVQSAYQQGLSMTTVSAARPAALEYTWSSNVFNHTATVNPSGNVASDTTKSNTLTIENKDETYDAGSVVITLKNPKTGASGIDEDLEDALDDVVITIDYGSLSNVPLLKDGKYTDRVIGSIPAGASVEVTIKVTFLEHDDGDFPDGATLKCKLFIWQPAADTIDTEAFKILT